MYDSNIYREHEATLEERIEKALDYLSVPTRLNGYRYLEMAIKIVAENSEAAYSITKSVFPLIAQKYETTIACVERSLRSAISAAWKNGNIGVQRKIFGNTIRFTSGRPTDSEFIVTLAKLISLDSE